MTRKSHTIWNQFIKIVNLARKGNRAKCKMCNKILEGQISRMTKHLSKCVLTGKFVNI